jgi:hypothetical protein
MHSRAHIKDLTSRRPQVIQIQLFGSDDNIKSKRDIEEIYIPWLVLYVIDFRQESETTHITGK